MAWRFRLDSDRDGRGRRPERRSCDVANPGRVDELEVALVPERACGGAPVRELCVRVELRPSVKTEVDHADRGRAAQRRAEREREERHEGGAPDAARRRAFGHRGDSMRALVEGAELGLELSAPRGERLVETSIRRRVEARDELSRSTSRVRRFVRAAAPLR